MYPLHTKLLTKVITKYVQNVKSRKTQELPYFCWCLLNPLKYTCLVVPTCGSY